MPVDVIIDPSSGQIYWNDAAGSGTQTIAISGNATNAINIVGYSNFFSPGGGGIGTQILATFTDSATSTFTPGTNAYDLGSSSLRWNFFGTGGNFTGVISTSSTTVSTSSTTGALTVSGGAGIALTSYFGQSVFIQGATTSTSTSTGALVVTGGVGIGGSLYTGTTTRSSISGVVFRNSRAENGFQINATSSFTFNITDEANNQRLNYHSDSNRTEFTGNNATHEIRLIHSNNSSYTGFRANSSGTVTYTLPAGDGSAGQVLYTNGSAGLAWTTPSGSAAGSSTQLQYNQGGAFGATNQLTYVPSTGILSTPNLTLTNSQANEGGEIVFNYPSSGTALTTTITVDIYQNRIRFFETGGANRGAYIDFTACSNSVGTNLLVGSGASGLTSLNGLTSSTQTFATGTSGTDFNISSSTSTHTFNIPYAGAASTGLITTQTQTIAGAKTFSGQTSITNSTASTSTTTGALIITGGVGIAGSIWSGQHIVTDTTTSSSTSTGAMLVYGGLGVSGQVNAASLQTTGNAIISGNLTFNGVGVFGNATSDTINSLARYISDILPSADNSYDLGNNSLGWRNFRVSGVGTIASLAVTSSTASTNTTSGALTVSGGAGIALTSYFGQDVKIQGTTASTSTTTGALTVSGGVGIGGSLWTSTSNLASVSGVTLNNGTITGTLSGTATSAQVLATTTDTSSTLYLLGSRSSTGFAGTAVYVDTNISFSGSTITASLTGTATTATAAIGVNVSNAATNSTHYILFSPTATGTGLATSTNTSLTYNPSTNILTAGTFSGSFSGSLTGTASIATSSVNLNTTTDTTSTLYLLGTRSNGGFAGTAVYVDTSISILGNTITATTFSGTASSATNTANINVTLDTTSTIFITGSRSNASIGSTPSYVLSGVSALGNTLTATTFVGALTGTASIATSSVNSATTTDTTSTLYLLGSRSSTGFAGTALYVDSSISILGSQITAGVWGGTAISAVNGGTGQNTYVIGDILYASSTSALTRLAAGTAGSVLKSNGAGTAPSWQVDSTGSGGAGTVAAPSAASLVAYYPGTGASVASYNRVSINTAAASMELLAQNSLPALLVNATNGASVDSVQFKSSFGDVYWALSNTTQSLKSTNGGILKIDGSGIITVTAPGSLTFYNSGETFYTSFIGAATANTTYTLPPTSPATGTSVLQSNTAGVLSWVAMSSGGAGTVAVGTSARMAYYPGTGSSVKDATGFEYSTSGTTNTVRVYGGSAIGNTFFIINGIGTTQIRVGIGVTNPAYELEIEGEISATNKSFVINHPLKNNWKLRYGSLEGPENGVYVRGILKDEYVIETPDYWTGLVHPESLTVTLTPIGKTDSILYVEKIEDYKVFINDFNNNPINCFFTVWAERIDIPKLVVEYENGTIL